MALTSKSSYVKPPRQVCLGRRAVGQDFSPSRLRFRGELRRPHRPPHSSARLGPSPVRRGEFVARTRSKPVRHSNIGAAAGPPI